MDEVAVGWLRNGWQLVISSSSHHPCRQTRTIMIVLWSPGADHCGPWRTNVRRTCVKSSLTRLVPRMALTGSGKSVIVDTAHTQCQLIMLQPASVHACHPS